MGADICCGMYTVRLKEVDFACADKAAHPLHRPFNVISAKYTSSRFSMPPSFSFPLPSHHFTCTAFPHLRFGSPASQAQSGTYISIDALNRSALRCFFATLAAACQPGSLPFVGPRFLYPFFSPTSHIANLGSRSWVRWQLRPGGLSPHLRNMPVMQKRNRRPRIAGRRFRRIVAASLLDTLS